MFLKSFQIDERWCFGDYSYLCKGLKVKHLKTYANFAKLNEVIIKPSIKEIKQKTDLKIKVELQRFGRRISHIVFRFKRDEQKDMFNSTNIYPPLPQT